MICFFFFQAEDGIRDYKVTGVQTCALPIYPAPPKRRDPADIIERFRIIDPKPARLYLEKHALEMLQNFDATASAAQQTQQDERPIEKDLKQSHVVSK